jgi:hypothetical protein
MTETSALPLAIEASGGDLGETCAALVENAWKRGIRSPHMPTR